MISPTAVYEQGLASSEREHLSMPLQNKRILVIGGSRGPRSLAYWKVACDAGAESVLVAINPNHIPNLTEDMQSLPLNVLCKIRLIPIARLTSHVTGASNDIAGEIIKACGGILAIDACITFQEDMLQVTADLANIFNVPACDQVGMGCTINKHKFRQALAHDVKLGNIAFSTLEEFLAGAAPSNLQFPVVIKPSEGCGSNGVFITHSMDELHKAKASYDRDRLSRNRVLLSNEDWLVEEFLEGPELGVELIMSDGEAVFASVMEATKTPPPLFQGTGRFYPTSLGRDADDIIASECIRAAKLLGLNNSVIDIDCKCVPGRGMIFIEINSRMGGHSVGLMHENVFGINLVLEHFRVGCGKVTSTLAAVESAALYTSSEDDLGRHDYIASMPEHFYTRIVLSEKSGIFVMESKHFKERLLEVLPEYLKPLLRDARLGKESGSRVNSEIMPVIMGFVLANGGSTEEARSNAEQLRIYASRLINDNIIVVPMKDVDMSVANELVVEGQVEVLESLV
jgi:glutathione synthase/RimK-type ligase-like ATP-grasp enzyme